MSLSFESSLTGEGTGSGFPLIFTSGSPSQPSDTLSQDVGLAEQLNFRNDFCSSSIQIIDLDECIGLSLATINTNFKLLQDLNCLTYDDLVSLQEDLSSLNSKYAELTSYRSRIAKATAAFDGTGTANPSVYSSFNIARILRTSTGVFELSFTTAFPNISYALIGTSNLKASSGGNFSWVMPTTTFAPTSATINIRDQSGVFVNPEYVSIAVYSL